MADPQAWVHLTDGATGVSYYANTETRETSWTLPPALGGTAHPLYLKLRKGWYQYEDDASGHLYYYNKHSYYYNKYYYKHYY